MKCDELKAFKQGSVELGEYWVYDAEDVDAAIAELKQKLADESEFGLNRAKSADHEIGKLCAELCELNAEIRRLKRALWFARLRSLRDFSVLAYFQTIRAKGKESHMDFDEMAYRIDLARVKCRAKAEEFK